MKILGLATLLEELDQHGEDQILFIESELPFHARSNVALVPRLFVDPEDFEAVPEQLRGMNMMRFFSVGELMDIWAGLSHSAEHSISTDALISSISEYYLAQKAR